ncbi:MAG: hypothetical protein R3A52_03395 [Polyangiales bacterium]
MHCRRAPSLAQSKAPGAHTRARHAPITQTSFIPQAVTVAEVPRASHTLTRSAPTQVRWLGSHARGRQVVSAAQ